MWRDAVSKSGDWYAHVQYGRVLLHEEKDPERALPHLFRALEGQPRRAESYQVVVACLLQLRRGAEAEALVRRGLELADSNALRIELARLLSMRGATDVWRTHATDSRWPATVPAVAVTWRR